MKLQEAIQTADWKKEKHAPVIECPDVVEANKPFQVTVSVGKDIPHPNTKEHWIEHISLWAGDFLAGRADLEPERAASEVVFKIKLEETTTLTAHAYCNLHGLWHSEEVTVEVEE
jgi:superoxide reductase